MAIVQKPFNQSIFIEKSGPPAWKQLPTWYQISDADHMIPPDVQRTFAKQMNATTISLPLPMHRTYHIQMKLRIWSSMQQKESNGDNIIGR